MDKDKLSKLVEDTVRNVGRNFALCSFEIGCIEETVKYIVKRYRLK